MECPRCKSHSVRIESGARVCGIPECLYVDLHPISFDNDIMHYEGEDRRENRFTNAYSNNLSNGGISLDRQANFDKNYRAGRKAILDLCLILKLNKNISDMAEARFLTILKLRTLRDQKDDDRKREQGRREEKDKVISIKNIAAYSVYSACFEKGNYFENFNIAKVLRMSMQKWSVLVFELNKDLKDKIDFVPEITAKHVLLRVCKRRGIAKQQENAMMEMYNRMLVTGDFGNRHFNTLAALIFWKICEYSQRYRNKLTLNEVCQKHKHLEEQGMSTSDIQKYIDITPDNVKKVFKEEVDKNFRQLYLPDWEGRIHLKCSTEKSEDDD